MTNKTITDLTAASALDGSELIAITQDGNSRGLSVSIIDQLAIAGLGEIAAILGQIAGQVNGGQVTLKGGTLADPALRIGTVGIYSSAADTLSIAIAGTEVARFTSSGLTIYGTVTEA